MMSILQNVSNESVIFWYQEHLEFFVAEKAYGRIFWNMKDL